jgi:hypothetical protein
MLFIKKIDFFDEMTHIIPVKNYSFQAGTGIVISTFLVL